MAALLFDTHKAVKDLQEAGFDEAQAEAVVATVGTAIIATKQDINDLRSEIATKSDMQTLGGLCSELKAMELRLTLRIGGMVFAGFALIALCKLL